MQHLAIVLRCLMATVFLAAVFGKLAGGARFEAFADSLRATTLLPPGLVRPVAKAAVLAELAVCILLVTPMGVMLGSYSHFAAQVGFALAAGLLVAFSVGIVSTIRRGVRVPCRCFGPAREPLGPAHVVRNLVLAGVAAVGAAVPPGAIAPGFYGTTLSVAEGVWLGIIAIAVTDVVALTRTSSVSR